MSYIGNLSTHRGLIGKIGEDIACKHLASIGHNVLERNIRIKYGEIDILSIHQNTLHFTEVKTVTAYKNSNAYGSVSAEEHIDWKKFRKMTNLAELFYKDYVNGLGKVKNIQPIQNKELGISLNFIGIYLNSKHELQKINYIEGLEI